MKTGPCSSYAPGRAQFAAAQRRNGAYETRAILSPASLPRRQQRSGLPTSVAVYGTQGRPASSVSRSSFSAAGSIARAS